MQSDQANAASRLLNKALTRICKEHGRDFMYSAARVVNMLNFTSHAVSVIEDPVLQAAVRKSATKLVQTTIMSDAGAYGLDPEKLREEVARLTEINDTCAALQSGRIKVKSPAT